MPFPKKGDVEKSPATRQMLISALDEEFLLFPVRDGVSRNKLFWFNDKQSGSHR
jgi:hypothetical protein